MSEFSRRASIYLNCFVNDQWRVSPAPVKQFLSAIDDLLKMIIIFPNIYDENSVRFNSLWFWSIWKFYSVLFLKSTLAANTYI